MVLSEQFHAQTPDSIAESRDFVVAALDGLARIYEWSSLDDVTYVLTGYYHSPFYRELIAECLTVLVDQEVVNVRVVEGETGLRTFFYQLAK